MPLRRENTRQTVKLRLLQNAYNERRIIAGKFSTASDPGECFPGRVKKTGQESNAAGGALCDRRGLHTPRLFKLTVEPL